MDEITTPTLRRARGPMRPTVLLALVLLALPTLMGLGTTAAAHQGGRSVPAVEVHLTAGAGLDRVVTVRITDRDSRDPVRGARVEGQADMSRPHRMNTFFGPLREIRPGTYRGPIRFPMPADWRIAVRVGGAGIVPAEATTPVRIAPLAASAAPPEATGSPVVDVRVEERLGGRDVTSMAVLWVHGGLSLVWLVGVAVVGLGSGLGLLSARAQRLLDRHRRLVVGGLTIGLPVGVIATGIYNLTEVSPVSVATRWSTSLDRFADLYRLTLAVKLTLFGVLLVLGAIVVRRVAGGARSPVRPGLALIALSPVLLMSAVALRYLHILTHVAGTAGP